MPQERILAAACYYFSATDDYSIEKLNIFTLKFKQLQLPTPKKGCTSYNQTL